MPGACKKQQYNVSLVQICVEGTGHMHLAMFSAVKTREFLHLPRRCGLLHLEGWHDFAWTCRFDLPSYFLPGPSAILSTVKRSIQSLHGLSICHLSHLHLPALPEADGNLAPELISHSCLETPGCVSGFSVQLFNVCGWFKMLWMLSRHNAYPDFNSFYYRLYFGSTVSPSSMGMGARKSLQAGRLPFHDVLGNYSVSASAEAALLSGGRPFTADEGTETWIYPIQL